MLKVQRLLKKNNLSVEDSLNKLKSKYGIESKVHEDGRVILTYSQINSPKMSPIARECRGLVLDTNNDWALVARSFHRFFNLGESRKEDNKFNWSNFVSTTKEDGSMIIVYYWHGQWRVNTKFSFGEQNINDLVGKSWQEVVFSLLDISLLDKSISYVFELCSPYNKVVRNYPSPILVFLSAFNGEKEIPHSNIDNLIKKLSNQNIIGVSEHLLLSDKHAIEYIRAISDNDPTFEGVVVRDCNNNRLKIKSLKYLQLHRLSNNGNLSSHKDLVSIVLSGETDEVTTYFPEFIEKVNKIKQIYLDMKQTLDKIYDDCCGIESQKDFALTIMQLTHITSPLFSARKYGGYPSSYITENILLQECD